MEPYVVVNIKKSDYDRIREKKAKTGYKIWEVVRQALDAGDVENEIVIEYLEGLLEARKA